MSNAAEPSEPSKPAEPVEPPKLAESAEPSKLAEPSEAEKWRFERQYKKFDIGSKILGAALIAAGIYATSANLSKTMDHQRQMQILDRRGNAYADMFRPAYEMMAAGENASLLDLGIKQSKFLDEVAKCMLIADHDVMNRALAVTQTARVWLRDRLANQQSTGGPCPAMYQTALADLMTACRKSLGTDIGQLPPNLILPAFNAPPPPDPR